MAFFNGLPNVDIFKKIFCIAASSCKPPSLKIYEIDAEKSIGVVYCDITGLKRVNDSMGHEAGVQLILRACDSLKKAFGEYGLFRIGGDELLALCAGIEHAALMERIGLLKECMKQNNVNMAVGEIWREKYQTG